MSGCPYDLWLYAPLTEDPAPPGLPGWAYDDDGERGDESEHDEEWEDG